MSFMTSVKQTTARFRGLPLDKMFNNTVVTEIADWDDVNAEAEEGA